MRRFDIVLINTPGFSMNNIRGMHWGKYAAHVEDVQQQTIGLAKAQRIPHLQKVAVDIAQTFIRACPDAGACWPTVKAAIDGLVQVGVLTDDTPQFVTSYHIWAPRKAKLNSVTLTLREVI
jgi:hypothetical protein